jgi:hypothetical protein
MSLKKELKMALEPRWSFLIPEMKNSFMKSSDLRKEYVTYQIVQTQPVGNSLKSKNKCKRRTNQLVNRKSKKRKKKKEEIQLV